MCGGAGCGRCGGISCEKGAVAKSEAALKFAKDAGDDINTKEGKTEEFLRGISQARDETQHSRNLAKEAYDSTLLAQNRSESAIQNTAIIIEKLETFLERAGAKPAEIRKLAEKVKSLDIHLEPAQITHLAQRINDTILSLTDIDTILEDTADGLKGAYKLKEGADNAKKAAEGILDTAQRVVEALDEAKEAQEKAEKAIQKANYDIEAAERDLTQIASETTEAHNKASETVADVNSLQDRLKTLQTQSLKNERDAREVASEGEAAAADARKARDGANRLHEKYAEANKSLSQRKGQSDQAQKRAMALLQKASQLSVSAIGKLKELRGMESNDHDDIMKEFQKQLLMLNERMALSLGTITQKSDYYRTCVS
ncbi:hypothetical protein J437_LFUL019405 [Ladona fulva]|uniref:Uncharacterized protein n=1 Tax=Ladona fulva TaxID=123851 RepID=A0A8K0PE62_LADFU|nr:hypothetical protein J437_LFUL019405 [Ladona fulva]